MERTPYCVPILRAHRNRWVRVVSYVMARQMSKTQGVMFNEMGRRADDQPGPMLYVGTTELFVRNKIEPKVTDMLRTTPSLRDKTAWGHGSSKYVKNINGIGLKLAWAGSDAMMQGDENVLVFVDEVDLVEAERPKATEGTVVGMAEATTSTFPDSLLSLTSTPTHGRAVAYRHPNTGIWHWAIPDNIAAEVKSGIWKYWLSGTRHEWGWPCPECRAYFVPRSNLLGPRGDDVTAAEANRSGHLVCPSCGSELRDTKRSWMNDRGVMIAPGQRPIDYDDSMGCYSDGGPGPVLEVLSGDDCTQHRVAWGDAHIEPGSTDVSFWVSGIASFSTKKNWGFLASQLAKSAQRKDPQAEQAVYNIDFGEVYQRKGSAPEWEHIKTLRDEYQLGQVPRPVTTLTIGVDVQGNRLVVVVRGWAPNSDLSSWLVWRGELWGETDQLEVWHRLREEVLRAEFDGLQVSLMAVDSGYRKRDVYDFCADNMALSVPTKGRDTMDRSWYPQPIELGWDDKTTWDGLHLWHVNTDVVKSWVHSRMRRPIDQPGAWRVPDNIDDDYCKQVTAESRVVENMKPKWLVHGENHYFDAECLAYFAAEQVQILAERPDAKREDQAMPPPGSFDAEIG